MKKILFFIITLAVSMLFIAGCSMYESNDTEGNNRQVITGEKIQKTLTSRIIKSEVDGSGQVMLVYHYEMSNAGQANTVTAYVAPDEVLVGGGGGVVNISTSAGAYLTGSFPLRTDTGNGWCVQTKDHITPCSHSAFAYAVGMKLINNYGQVIDKRVVADYVIYMSNTSAIAQHPSETVYIPSNYQLIGGGARVDFPFGFFGINPYGNLLTESMPVANVNGWRVSSKDHGYPSPTSITAFAIGIRSDIPIPDFGYLRIFIDCSPITNSTANTEAELISQDLTGMYNGWCIVGVGGYTHYESYGRLLRSLFPYPNGAYSKGIIIDKDCCYPDTGFLDIRKIWVQKQMY